MFIIETSAKTLKLFMQRKINYAKVIINYAISTLIYSKLSGNENTPKNTCLNKQNKTQQKNKSTIANKSQNKHISETIQNK